MLDKIIRFSIQNKLVIGLFTLALIAWGSYSLTKLPIDAVPDITDNQVMVITVSPTLAAQEVEQLVTFPVEQVMVNIPDIQEMRSFSRFGLSIVTIVFKEHVDLYWARQQVQERLTLAEKEIPEGIGKPEMAPVTTGLGEIYQYVISPEPGYEEKYDATELRSIQDWIIKRQLLGTPGVAEVSGFGGFVKQYEIAVDPEKLNSLDISLQEIFEALEKNNQNTGGAYIDKGPNAYFIRSEGLVNNLEEIKKIVIKVNKNGTPVLVRDAANVQFGHGVRYGAATRNGKGEVVTGIVMMLKGANSSEVINNVKAKIEQIKTTLPEGVTIEPYLDRKKLVDGAISTVLKNLIEGALIVIFILILFLGNLRGGLVVASVIPLAMLFAVAMMNLFGVSGNLMSLGAIDFGLIVDGAVIIVEAVIHGIILKKRQCKGVARLTSKQMDEEVLNSSSKIRSSAAFGEIIILIVYLPLWTLVGVEGKMFTPMAQTVSFAILGAFLLSLTYVPMMTALVLSKKTEHKENFSDKMMNFFQKMYRPVIEKAIHRKGLVVFFAAAAFVSSVFVFHNMGGEFIPQLDEGDFAVETRVPVGSSIHESIKVSEKAQKILLTNFPEVEQVVNKIGSGEIPTDPMPIEAGDMMVVLKPKKEWTTTDDKEVLIEKMQEALSVIPNATFSFQQPIQMRFNELLTGAKQDVVIKVYGEDLNILSDIAKGIGKRIGGIEGVEDLYVETVTGLPQIQIQYNRDKIAEYGMNVQEINDVIKTAFAGRAAGLVFEGERRFDLVVRFDKEHRTGLKDVQNIYVNSPKGRRIPLSELAEVSFQPGPVQIQRDNAKRRITIGFNVRSRDVKSIVADIKEVIGNKVSMPAGYYVTYGGQFKNLQEASARLAIAVPVALLLIFVLLYFTFHSLKQGLLIFTAIPLSAIGGVYALVLRDMPFSISAGVGFIALFGVAVLNGIVLIGEFNRLEKEGIKDVYERVLKGTEIRLRPVLMTALVASLGFLPMALSTTSGAEVQRPLATVVIGGLLSATLLTLIVLPVLYIYFSKTKKSKPSKGIGTAALFLLMGIFAFPEAGRAQEQEQVKRIGMDEAVAIALKNNLGVKAADYEVQRRDVLKKGAIALPKTDISYSKGELSNPGIQDNEIRVEQSLNFPTAYVAAKKLAKAELAKSRQEKTWVENQLIADVKSAYMQYVFVLEKRNLLLKQDSIFNRLEQMSEKRYQSGESTKLESLTSSAQAMQIRNLLEQNAGELQVAQAELEVLLHTKELILPSQTKLEKEKIEISGSDAMIQNNPEVLILENELEIADRRKKLAIAKMLPDLKIGYSSQTFKGAAIPGATGTYGSSDRFSSWQIGVAIPLFPGGNRSKIKANQINKEIAKANLQYRKETLQSDFQKLYQQYLSSKNTIEYYESKGLIQADLIRNNSDQSFRNGELSYLQYLQNINMAIDIQSAYTQSLYQYNQTVIRLKQLLAIKKSY